MNTSDYVWLAVVIVVLIGGVYWVLSGQRKR